MGPPETPPKDDATQVGRNGWRQASIAARECFGSFEASGFPPPAPDCLALVLSHDCDVVSPSFEKEPLAEFVWLAPIAKSEGSMTRAKNPRCLHVRLHREGGADAWYEAAAARRFAVSRRLLLDLRPSTEWSVPQETKRLAAGWTARRYDRPAFPDAFNSRLPKKKLTRALDSGGESIERLYISVADEELPDDQPYSVILCAVMRVEDFEDPDKRAQADYCLQELAGLLDDEAGIVVTEPYLMSELEFSLDDERQMKRWSDFDWLSSPEPQD